MKKGDMKNEPLCSLEETIMVCLNNPEFMREYKRLSGASLGSGSPITVMIDKSTGYDEVEAKALYEFIRDYIWKPVIAQVVMEQVKEHHAE